MKKLVEQTQFWCGIIILISFLFGLFIGYHEYIASIIVGCVGTAVAIRIDLLYKKIGKML